jgi:hypothetical protein
MRDTQDGVGLGNPRKVVCGRVRDGTHITNRAIGPEDSGRVGCVVEQRLKLGLDLSFRTHILEKQESVCHRIRNVKSVTANDEMPSRLAAADHEFGSSGVWL